MRMASAAARMDEGVGPPAPFGAAPAVSVAVVPALSPPLAAEWQALAAEAAEPNAFAEPWFVDASLRHLAAEPISLVSVRQDGRLIGAMPVLVERHYGRIPVPHVENWRHHHLFLGTPLVRRGHEQPFWRAVLDALDASKWARGFLHVRDLAEHGPVHGALRAVAASLGRPCPTVLRERRAFLQSTLDPIAYYEQTVRKKKRKELGRLRKRLADEGAVVMRELAREAELESWCEAFLALERSGWKGRQGSALACRPATSAFFREAVAGAFHAGRLQVLRMDLDGRPIAMLVNFLTPPGSFSFKTAFDEAFARFSPGVLIQLENLHILDRDDIAWMDSCAAEQHPMIDSLWAERRTLVRVTVPLSGLRRRLAFAAARSLEEASAVRRRLASRGTPAPEQDS